MSTKKTNNQKTVCNKIKRIRLKTGYSIAEMAAILGLKKTTYQGYEDGSRTAPDNLISQMEHYQKIGAEFSKTLPKRIDRAAKKMHPHGIMSDVEVWE